MVIALLGFGTVGEGVYRMLQDREDIRVKYVLCRRTPEHLNAILTHRIEDIVSDPEVETVVEVMGGLDPAEDYVCRALAAGKHVVSANKLLIATRYRRILNLAHANQVAVRCTAAVGGGIPWLIEIERCKRTDSIFEITGIMNGTTNYILDTMQSSDACFAQALAQAQNLGYAEQDPSSDIDGVDSCCKLVISANLAFDVFITRQDVEVFGIRTIQTRDIEDFRAHGLCCRLIASAEHYFDTVSAVVEPTLVSATDMEAAVRSNYNLISLVSHHAGRQSYFGQGAGRWPTAYNVLQDLLDIAAGVGSFYQARLLANNVDNSHFVRRYYVRTEAVSPWLEANTEARWSAGVITKPLPASRVHDWAARARQEDPGLFFAALRLEGNANA